MARHSEAIARFVVWQAGYELTMGSSARLP